MAPHRLSSGLDRLVLSLLHGRDNGFTDTLLVQGNDICNLRTNLYSSLADLVNNHIFAQPTLCHGDDIGG